MNTLAAISLKDAMVHLKIDDEDDIENNYIQSLINVAEDLTEQKLFCSIDELFIKHGSMPPTVRQYIFVVMTELYANRQLTTDRPIKVNPFYERLIDKYVDYTKGV